MKKILYSLLSLMGFSFSTHAQSHINIELLGATYTTPAVQFRVSWNSIPSVNGETHNSKIWLWVDYVKIENNQLSGTWTRATVANPSPGTIAPETNKGFWLQGNSGSYDQIVTVALTNIPANTKFNWCAYTSDCPPFVIANNGTYTLQGMPPFILKSANGATLIVEGNTLPASSLTIAAETLTDKTECPSFFCAYTGSDLFRDETHLCGHRPSGARNWEAWIKDSRDNQLYRIVQMPSNTWWMAQDLVWDGKSNPTATGYTVRGTERNCGAHCGCGRFYGPDAQGAGDYSGNDDSRQNNDVCPSGWVIPSRNELTPYMWLQAGIAVNYATCEIGGIDTYGLSLFVCGNTPFKCGILHSSFRAGNASCWRWVSPDVKPPTHVMEGCNSEAYTEYVMNVRCVR